MPNLLLAISYFLDLTILLLLVILIIGLLKLLKILGQFSALEQLKMAPELLFKHPAYTFQKYAPKNDHGVHTSAYSQHRNIQRFVRHVLHSTLLILLIKIMVLGLSFNIPRQSFAQFEPIQYKADKYSDFQKGDFNQSEWDVNGLTIVAGQTSANYISSVIELGNSTNQWTNLSWQQSDKFNQKPVLPTKTLAYWPLDNKTSCQGSGFPQLNCEISRIQETDGIYNSKSYYFDGQFSKIKINGNMNINGSFTMAAWIKPAKNILNGSQTINQVIWAKGYGDYAAKTPYEPVTSYYFGIKDGSLSLIYLSDKNKDHWTKIKNNDINLFADTWYQVAVTFDSSKKQLKLYIDGYEYKNTVSDYDGQTINHVPDSQSNYPSWIGGIGYKWLDGQEYMNNLFQGSIDEIMITNTVLTPLEIRQLVSQASQIAFQVRTGDSLPLVNNFTGPDGSSLSYFTKNEKNDLKFLGKSKYLQYIAFLTRPDINYKPKLNSVVIDYLTEPNSSNLKIASQTQLATTTTRNLAKEKQALDIFINIFNALPKNDSDWKFINTIAYNYKTERDLSKEQKALEAFINHYKKIPQTGIDWGIINALAYTDKGKLIISSWSK